MAPRKPRTPVTIAENTPAETLTQELVNAATTPAVDEIIGTSVPSTVVEKPITPAGVNLADDKGLAPTPAALPVPATPTVAQVAARMARTDGVDVAFSHFYGKRTIAAAGAFVEPDEDQIETLIDTYKAEHGVKTMAAAVAVKESIDSQRAAYNAAAADQGKIDREWLSAYKVELLNHLATIDTLITSAGGKIGKTTKTDDTTTRKTRTSTKNKWSELAPKLLDYADKLDLVGFYFVDITVGGYKGKPHPVRLHRDGIWTKATNNVETHELHDTGDVVSDWKYFDKEGNDRTDATPANMIPQHALSKDEMFGVLMLKKDGTILDVPGLTHDRKDSAGKRVAGTAKHYADTTAFFAEAGVGFES